MIEPIEQIKKAKETDKISGSWLITGGYDYEKISFIYDICSVLLNKKYKDKTLFEPDVKWLECGLTDEAKRDIQKMILAGKSVDTDKTLSYKREITIDDIREGIQFLSLKGSASGYRILIINPADKMNENAANALLKVLEEPTEKSVILLLCQNMGKLLPTIKSRCRQIKIKPLSDKVLADKIKQAYPEIEDVSLVVSLSKNSFGQAKEICENNGLEIYNQMILLFQNGVSLEMERVQSFIEMVSKETVSFSLAKNFLSDFVADQVKANALSNPFIAEDLLDIWAEINQLFIDIDRIYLDKKQVLQTVVFKIAEVLK